MKYSIMGFNQAKLLQFNLNLSEVLLLSYIYDAQASPTMSHIIEDGKTYTWLNHSKIQSDLPILDVNERQLKYYLNHLTSYNLITAKQTTVAGIRGSRAYYGITEICESLRYDNADTEQGQKIAPNTPSLGAKNCPSDNQLNLDNKLDNTISKDIVAKAPPEISQENTQDNPRQPYIENDTEGLSEFEQHMYSDDVKKKRKIEGATTPKAKKLSLWDKCVQAIEEYTDNEQLQEALTDYLKLRLSMRDKPIYIAQWKALLKKIDTCSGDPVQVVKQSTELGYASFYDLRSYTQRPRRVDIISSETENMSCRKVSAEERREILEHGEVF